MLGPGWLVSRYAPYPACTSLWQCMVMQQASCFCTLQIGSASCINMLCLMPYTTTQGHQAAQPKPLYHETGSAMQGP